ncbi:LysR family transcriptional regulator [Paucimonas lemoignei]|nr:LysR family transcriptional regulator [Paucimonas lemoignei]
MDFDWNDLKFFLAAARQGGLTGAAKALRTSASTVSRHITTLEQRLQATLFLRQQTGYLLTDDGSALLKHVENVEQAMMAAERNALGSIQQEVTGKVRLATTEMLAVHLIAPHLHALQQRHPRLQLEIGISLSRANLSRREADLALRMVEPSRDDGAGDYIAQQVGKLDCAPYCLSNLVSPKKSNNPEAWQKLDYISWDESWADLPMAKWLRAAFPGKAPVLSCNSMQVQHAAIRSGMGVGMLPCFVGDQDTALQRLGSREPPLSRAIWLVYHRDLKASQRVIAMREFIQEIFHSYL